jgi:hypothetical protein
MQHRWSLSADGPIILVRKMLGIGVYCFSQVITFLRIRCLNDDLKRVEHFINSRERLERELIRARTGEGRKRAMANGVKFGRPRALSQHQQAEIIKRGANGETLSVLAIGDVNTSTMFSSLDPPYRRAGAGPRHANHEPPGRRRPAIDVDDFLADRGPSWHWPFATLTLDSSPLGRLSLGPGRCVGAGWRGMPACAPP